MRTDRAPADTVEPTKSRRPRELEILRSAAAILRGQGDRGLSMRAVAAAVGISLSNVQYYFSDKDALLEALVEDYFDECAQLVARSARDGEGLEGSARLTAFLTVALSEDGDMAEMCAMFREVWAISTRNEQIAGLLKRYYEQTSDLLLVTFFPEVSDEQTRRRIALLLMSFIEGFSITGPPAGMTVEDSARAMSDATFSVLTAD